MLKPHEINHAENIIRAVNKATFNNMTGVEIMAFFHSLTWLAEVIKISKTPPPEVVPEKEAEPIKQVKKK